MHLKSFLLSIILLFCIPVLRAQESFPKNAAREPHESMYALSGANIYTDAETLLYNAVLLIQNGSVIACGTDVAIPPSAIHLRLNGKYIYPGFIDLYSTYGIEAPATGNKLAPDPEGLRQSRKGPWHWNECVKPEFQSAEHVAPEEKSASTYRQNGFCSVLSHHADGIARGTGTLLSLAKAPEHECILKTAASQHFSFSKGSSKQAYPTSQMGIIALLRQSHYDALWYEAQNPKIEVNASLHAWNCNKSLPAIFETREHQELFRAQKLASEIGWNLLLKGSGDEYQRAEEIKKSRMRLIVPLNFPEAYDLSDPGTSQMVSLSEMRHWEWAPFNARVLHDYEIPFCFSSAGLKHPQSFLKQLRKAVDSGLPKEAALKALTSNPAAFIGVDDILGSLYPGKIASFFIADGDIFHPESVILQTWVQGEPYTFKDPFMPDMSGRYQLNVGDSSYRLELFGNLAKLSSMNDSTFKPMAHFSQKEGRMLMHIHQTGDSNSLRLNGWKDGRNIRGTGHKGTKELSWEALFLEDIENTAPKLHTTAATAPLPGNMIFPFSAYGRPEVPKEEEVLFKEASVWTNEAEGICSPCDVHIRSGKIVAVGRGLTVNSAKIIHAKGLHLSSGIIDEHSHIAISKGVNESGQASTAEVSIEDVIHANDINMYRQLAGGVTAAQLLHGSANPIGGKSALIKLRWGLPAQKLPIEGADGFIKFALGENVKQSNWGEHSATRFPQTRMGVEALYYDYFHAARNYDQSMRSWNELSSKQKSLTPMPRRDLDLETLAQILNQKRFITCHSYVQSEINMLMHVADSMGFKINTFTHILEGYKVADKLKQHGAGASSFSDWWAYKFEVNDAIPWNGALLHKNGVLTAFNSDDAEMARRLNQEAAKAVKYGGLSEEEAWKFVTLNPAKLLHLDHRMGSLKPGKDADLVLWSENPLSIYARTLQTWVDGRMYYSEEQNRSLEEHIAAERARLIQKMLDAAGKGAATQPVKAKNHKLYHCDTEEEDL